MKWSTMPAYTSPLLAITSIVLLFMLLTSSRRQLLAAEVVVENSNRFEAIEIIDSENKVKISLSTAPETGHGIIEFFDDHGERIALWSAHPDNIAIQLGGDDHPTWMRTQVTNDGSSSIRILQQIEKQDRGRRVRDAFSVEMQPERQAALRLRGPRGQAADISLGSEHSYLRWGKTDAPGPSAQIFERDEEVEAVLVDHDGQVAAQASTNERRDEE